MSKSVPNHLQKAICQLPEHAPAADTWERIARTLDASPPLSVVLTQLPKREPRQGTWDQISEALPSRPQRSAIHKGWWYAAAASVTLLVGIFFLWQYTRSTPEITLTYSEETTLSPPTERQLADDPLEHEAQTYIEKLCQTASPLVCQQPEFLALKAHLAELSEEEKELRVVMERSGYDPRLVKYQVRIENMKASATRELVQMVIG